MSPSKLGLEDFPDRRLIFEAEGGSVYEAERNGNYYIIVDEGTLADLLSEDELGPAESLVRIREFETKSDRENYVRQRGWRRSGNRRSGPQR
jgi:hypothetical protein